jgi:D-specific alpha-keto acid dehydrogenase
VTGTLGHIPGADPSARRRGITVYGCEQDEAELFNALSPRFGIIPTITSVAVSGTSVISVPRNRCISVGHKSKISGPILRALKDAGVEYISTRSIGVDHIDLDAAATLGITVDNVVYAPDGVADYALMLILMAIRNAKEVVTSADQHDFRLGGVRGRDLRDMTVGVGPLGPGDVVLVKGSLVAGLQPVAERLAAGAEV